MIRSLAAVAIPLFGELNARTSWRDFLLQTDKFRKTTRKIMLIATAVMEKEIFSYYLEE